MNPELSRRLATACHRGDAMPAERKLLIDAVNQPGVETVEDLPAAARRLLRVLEARGRNRT